MAEVLFALVASFAVALGGRDQRLVAALRDRLGPGRGLLTVALASAAATAALASWAGSLLAGRLSDSAAPMFLAIALALAAGELAWPLRREETLAEPTRSLGAIAIVLFARQITDAARFVLAALAVALAHPPLVALGGALGGGAAVALGWALGARLATALPLRRLRLALAVLSGAAALYLAALARGLVG